MRFDPYTQQTVDNPTLQRIYCPELDWPSEELAECQTCNKSTRSRRRQSQTQTNYRLITLWIPFCDLCKQPRFTVRDDETAEDQQVMGGIEGIEMELNFPLWKDIHTRYKSARSCQSEAYVTTGFIHRPCDTCIDLETVLRGRVIRFLDECQPVEAWAVWHWLLLRGAGLADFWNHEMKDAGLPDTMPPPRYAFQKLMSDGWRAKTGVAWEDVCDFGPPVECPLKLTPHREEFMDLSQWNRLAGIVGQPDPVVQPPPPPLDIDGSSQATPETEAPKGSAEKESPRRDSDGSRPVKKVHFVISPKPGHAQLKDSELLSNEERLAKYPKNATCQASPSNTSTSSSDSVEPQHDSPKGHPSPASIDDLFGDSEMNDTDDLFGDIEMNDVLSKGTEDLLGDTEMNDVPSDGAKGHATLKKCDRGFWHLNDGTVPDYLWHLPLGVKPRKIDDEGQQ
ncbi:hypothetical protein F5B20DRAFT_533854 [Whalleya microplaca]|nr:hypothetical protein F5B20DRAFT_533854 [Whalleya microplaca]